jgi:hypothetical protein
VSADLPVPVEPKRAMEAQRREEAASATRAIEALLAVPAYEHHLGVNMLAKICTDANAPVRERRRASEVLAASEVKLRELLATIAGARDLALADLGSHPAQLRATAAVAVNVETGPIVRMDEAWWKSWQQTPNGRAFVTAQRHAVWEGSTIEDIVDAGVEAIRQGRDLPMHPGRARSASPDPDAAG